MPRLTDLALAEILSNCGNLEPKIYFTKKFNYFTLKNKALYFEMIYDSKVFPVEVIYLRREEINMLNTHIKEALQVLCLKLLVQKEPNPEVK